jgi:hypothetical protein
MPPAGARMASEPLRSSRLNLSPTATGTTRHLILYAANRSSFSWQIAHSAGGGFDASFCFERRVDGQPYSECGTLHLLSRDIALLWLCVQAVMRGFDARGVR